MKRRHFIKCLVILLSLMAIATMISCSPEVKKGENSTVGTGTGYVSFNKGHSKGADLMAYINYPDVYSLTWTVTSTKADSGSTVGEGVIENALITDSFGPYSVGRWSFTMEGYDDKSHKLYEGSIITNIVEGDNDINITLNPPAGENGFIVFENCNFDSNIGNSFRVIKASDESTLMNMPQANCTLRDDGLYDVPRARIQIASGTQIIHIYIGNQKVHEMLVRVFANYETVITYGTFEGQLTFNVIVNQTDAIVSQI